MVAAVLNSFNKKLFWLGVTFTTAVCSILYELVLAQTLSSVMGNTAYRYNLTIGLYIASMGLGAMLVDRVSKKDQLSYFMRVEILIAILGAVAPWIVIMNDSFLQNLSSQGAINYYSPLVQYYSSIFNNGLIVLIGFLSGLELPLLMRIGKTVEADSKFQILSVDYLGTTVGAAIFPLVLFPMLNLFSMVYSFSLINILMAILVAHKFQTKNIYKTISYVWLILLMVVLFNSEAINYYLVNLFYVKG